MSVILFEIRKFVNIAKPKSGFGRKKTPALSSMFLKPKLAVEMQAKL